MAQEKIMVVDDDQNICELLRLYLEKDGYNVTIYNDGEDALKNFDSAAPDLMLLDNYAARPGRLADLPGSAEKIQRPHYHAYCKRGNL